MKACFGLSSKETGIPTMREQCLAYHTDPCDNCNKPCCYDCPYANCDTNEEPTAEEIRSKERTEYLSYQVHQAQQVVWWLSYQPEVSDSEHRELERMSTFLANLHERIR